MNLYGKHLDLVVRTYVLVHKVICLIFKGNQQNFYFESSIRSLPNITKLFNQLYNYTTCSY